MIAGSLIGHTGYYVLLQHYEVSLVGSVLLLSPAIGVVGGIVILGEPFTPLIIAGGIITLTGVAIVLRGVPMRSLEPAEGV